MKILYHHRIASKDGQAVHIEELIGALRAAGCEVVVVAPHGWSQTSFGGGGGATAALRRLLPRAVSELLEIGYNLVAYRRLAQAARLHRPDALYERHNLFLLAGAWVHRRLRLPYLLEVNSPLHVERAAHGGLGLRSLARRLEERVWRSADRVLPVTEVLAGMIEAGGVPRARLRVIANGIDPAAFARAPAHEAAQRALGCDGRLVLGFTGFVREWHGLDQVIDYMAGAARSDLFLLVVGDGPAREGLLAQAARLGLADRVRFTGVVERERIPECVAAFDIALQPAATAYASPLKLFEYFALGRAVIAPRQPNLAEIIEDGVNGLLFDPAAPGALAAALARLVDDAGLRARLGESARATIERRQLTWAGNAAKVMALVRELQGAPPVEHGSDPNFLAYYEKESLSPATVERFGSVQGKALALLAARGRGRGSLRVADIGCGAGTQAQMWAELGHEVQGLDVNAPLIEVARRRAEAGKLPIRYDVGTATALPYADASFDVCLMPELLEHVPDWEACLREAVRVLAPGGLLYLSTTNYLCPVQQEFNLPGYGWYPGFVKRYCERLAVTTQPQLASFAKYPAVNWFSPYRLRAWLAPRGFDCLDRFDMIDASKQAAAARLAIESIRALPPLRLLGHMMTEGTVVFAIKQK